MNLNYVNLRIFLSILLFLTHDSSTPFTYNPFKRTLFFFFFFILFLPKSNYSNLNQTRPYPIDIILKEVDCDCDCDCEWSSEDDLVVKGSSFVEKQLIIKFHLLQKLLFFTLTGKSPVTLTFSPGTNRSTSSVSSSTSLFPSDQTQSHTMPTL